MLQYTFNLVGLVVGLVGLVASYYFYLRSLKSSVSNPAEFYGEKLERLVKNLTETSKEVDNILVEIARTAQDREAKIKALEDEIKHLEISENEYKERIENLKNIPLPAIDHLMKQIEPSEKRNARRDYVLFFLGIVISAIGSLIFNILGLGH